MRRAEWLAAADYRLADLAPSLFHYVWATSWAHQLPLSVLTGAVLLLEVVPLEYHPRLGAGP